MQAPTPTTDLPRPTKPTLVVFAPGLLSTSRFFEVAADPSSSLVTWFADAGYAVLPWDPPGLGRNRASAGDAAAVDFKSRVEALIAALEEAEKSRRRVILVGHSLGGTLIYAALAILERRGRRASLEPVDAVITIASPARLDAARDRPWDRLFFPATGAIIDRLRRRGWVSLPAFILAQGQLSTSPDDRWVPRGALASRILVALFALVLALAKRSRRLCRALVEKPPIPSTFLRNPGDFTADQFQRFLAAGVLERDSARLLKEVVGWGCDGGKIVIEENGEPIDVRQAYLQLRIPTLVVSSSEDRLVLAREAQAMAGPHVTPAPVGPCGHGGYLFKAWNDTRSAIAKFLAPIVAPRST